MEVTEHTKLIYQLSLLQYGPLEYSKNPFLICHESHNIWVKRAYKKGYVNLVSENKRGKVYELNDKGKELLKKYPEYHLQNTKKEVKHKYK